MENTVYCLASSEPQANEILTHLRNLGFAASEISVLLKTKETKNITVEEDVIRGAKKGVFAGGVFGVVAGLTALSIPAIGPLLAAGPIVAALTGAAAGGVVGALAGGSGALARLVGIPERDAKRIEQTIHDGGILVAVHSDDPLRRDKALRV